MIAACMHDSFIEKVWLDNIHFVCMLDNPREQSLDVQTDAISVGWKVLQLIWLISPGGSAFNLNVSVWFEWFGLGHLKKNVVVLCVGSVKFLEGQSTSEFRFNPKYKHLIQLIMSFRLIWKQHGLCVGAGLKKKKKSLRLSRIWVWHPCSM